MRIKRIEIIGFKSFCDRTVLSFSDPITAVVGPNGCGKSNIVDAIRWCMGEQSAKHLRGKAMDDVIFAGSDSRGPAAMCEVSLTFEEVGFSHETLQLALGEDEALAQPALVGTEPEAGADGEGAPTTEAEAESPEAAAAGSEAAEPLAVVEAVADSDSVSVSAAESGTEAEAGEGAPAAEAAPSATEAETGPSASDEVEAFLADKPAAIDFSQYSEVTITRRLFRDGTSIYMLNKTPCRLRDITDFFLGTGVGTKAYSIIEQGRVGMIVSSRPQDRRALIEEAAGITKFKTKKRAAERKLEQTRQNLLRVSDIVAELAKRMGSLRRQAQKAERYRRYRSEVKDIDMWKATHRYLEFDAHEKVLAASLAATEGELESMRAEFESQDARAVAERAELAVEERRLAALQEAIYELDNRIKLSESKVQFQEREAGELDERVASAQGEIKELRSRREEAAADLEAQRAELAALDQRMQVEEESVAARDAAAAEARQLLTEAQRRLDEARQQLSQARADMARADSQKQALARRREESERRLERVVAETDTGNARVKALDKEQRGLDGELSRLKQTRLDLGAQSENLEARHGELCQRADECEARVETLRTELHRRRSRLQSLEEIHAKYEGFARGTRAVMQEAPELAPEREIRGLVADVIEAPVQLETAVEAALGDRLGGILVTDRKVGLQAIRYLKENNAGRSAFVPFRDPGQLSAFGGNSIEVEDRSGEDELRGEGVLGPIADLVKFDSGFDQVGRSLLGQHIVVDTLERALELHERGVGRTLVTLEGDLVDERGVVTGGSREAQGASVLSQKREIRELQEIVAELESDLTEATARQLTTRQELQTVTKTLNRLRSETHEGELAITAHEKDVGGIRSELERLRERLTQLNAEQLELEERLRDLEAEERAMKELHASATERIDRFEKDQLGMIEGVTEGQLRVEALAAELTEAKVRAAQLGEKRASVRASALQLEVADRELAERIGKLEATIAEGTERAASLRADSAELRESLVSLREDRRGKAETLEEGRNGYEMRMGELQMMEIAVREMRARSEKLSGQVNSARLELSQLDMNRRILEEAIEERYHLSLRRHLGEYHLRPQVGPEEDKRLTELKKLIERMGADINLTAIEEYAEVSERHEFLSTQQADLENAVEQLEKAINKINRTSRKLFRDTYDAINATFQDVFPRLFRGGRARLQLTGVGEGGDILEAGVEIFAQPPGKKNATVDQLSGGEKALTAVALIFSIFLIKPSPFCLLDEVDAPLDDANVDRYNEIVREMTDRSQFIVITHNKRTMEIADHLYGVTMQEPGVSKIVSVNLSKVDGKAAA
jgi:chromosome segregation protein